MRRGWKIERIAFDFDGVIADTDTQKRKWLLKNNIKVDKADKTSIYQELTKKMKYEKIDKLYKEMSNNIFLPDVLEKTKPLEDSINAIKKLSSKFDIYIVTSRTDELIKPVRAWLEKYDIDTNIRKIISSSYQTKQDICLKNDIFFLCDDDLRHINDKKINMRVLFNKNIQIDDEEIIRVNSWKELEQILL